METQIQDFRGMKSEELMRQIASLEQVYRASRAAVREGKERNSASLGEARRVIARAKTVLREMNV